MANPLNVISNVYPNIGPVDMSLEKLVNLADGVDPNDAVN